MRSRKLTIKIAQIILVLYWIGLVVFWPLAPLAVRPAYAAEVTLDYNDISVDGYVDIDAYYESSERVTNNILNIGEGDGDYYNSSYIDWDTGDIPDGSTINSVSLVINVSGAYGAGDTVDIKQMDNVSTYWPDSNDGNNNFYDYIVSEATVYVDNSTDFQSTGSKTIPLGSTAASDLQSQLGSDWFSISFNGSDVLHNYTNISSEENATPANRPQLLVNYTESGGGPVPEFTTTGMLIAVFGSLAGYVMLQRQWNMAEERKRVWRR